MLGAPPKTAITFFDAGDPNAIKQWFTPDPYLPEGARLKVRDRPEDDADVVSGVDLGYAVQVICNARDWVMVVYMETVEDPNKRMQFKDVRREGWMLLRTSRRTLACARSVYACAASMNTSPIEGMRRLLYWKRTVIKIRPKSCSESKTAIS